MLAYYPTFIINKNNSEKFEERVRESSFYKKSCVIFLTSIEDFLSIYNEFEIGFKFRLLIHPALVGNTEIKSEHLSYAKKIVNSFRKHPDFKDKDIPLISESTTLQSDTERSQKSFHNYFGYKIYDLTQSGSKEFIDSLPVFQKETVLESTMPKISEVTSDLNIEEESLPKITVLTALTKDEYSSFRENTNKIEENEGVLKARFKPDDSFSFDYKHPLFFERQKNRMGSVESAITTSKIYKNGTNILIMSGVCGGRKSEVKLYDIIISSDVVDIITGKYEGNTFVPIGYQEPTNEHLIDHLSESQRLNEIKNRMYSLVPNNKNSERINEIINDLDIKIGVLACGSFVLKSGGFLETKSKEINDKIIGFEMESYGVMRATKYLNNSKNLSLVVKSVMDYTDEKKSDSVIGEPVKSIAAFMSYLCVRVLIPYIDEFYKENILK